MPVAIGCGIAILGVVVIVVVLVVASVAIPQLVMAKEKAFDDAAKAELQSVVAAQEAYRVERGSYAWDLYELSFDDDPEVTTTIQGGGGFYSICSSHPRSRSSWWVDSDRRVVERRWHIGC